MKTVAAFFFGPAFWLLSAQSGTTLAEEKVYKSVDEHGRVTYSTSPPEGARSTQTLDVPPPPTEEQTKEAQERVQKLEEATDKAEKQRREREQAEAAAHAQQPTGIYITPGPVFSDAMAPYSYPVYGDGYWGHPPPYRPPGTITDRPSRPGTGTRPRPTPRR